MGNNISKEGDSPTWKSIVNIHLNAVVDNNSVTARNEIIRMAICADDLQLKYNELLAKYNELEEELSNLETEMWEQKNQQEDEEDE